MPNTVVSVSLPKPIAQWLDDRAKSERRSRSQMLSLILERVWLDERGTQGDAAI
jgi:metal-responsive CopG/Arc/MetJ family transcriptional regulator